MFDIFYFYWERLGWVWKAHKLVNLFKANENNHTRLLWEDEEMWKKSWKKSKLGEYKFDHLYRAQKTRPRHVRQILQNLWKRKKGYLKLNASGSLRPKNKPNIGYKGCRYTCNVCIEVYSFLVHHLRWFCKDFNSNSFLWWICIHRLIEINSPSTTTIDFQCFPSSLWFSWHQVVGSLLIIVQTYHPK